MMIRLNIWMPLVFGLTAVWMSGLSQAAPQRGGGKVTPTLTVSVSSNTIAEGKSATGTVSRVNASLDTAVVVTLTSNDTSEAKFDVAVGVVKTVTIPISASSTTFTVTGVNDGTGDGAKTVTITAAATGFKSGSVNVTAASPALPPVRYRVQLIPVTTSGMNLQDVNDNYEVVGWIPGDLTGFYYNAVTRTFLTATQMLPELQGRSTQFIGINNLGWIVGSLADSNGMRSGILIYPPTSTSGWSYDVVPGPVNAYEYYPRDINDFGDIVGVYWRTNADGTRGLTDAFAYNPGLLFENDLLAATPFGLAQARLYSIQVSNIRRGLAVEHATGDGWWFDFAAPIPETRVTPVGVPEPYYINLRGNQMKCLSNDGQLAVAKIASITKVRGEYTYTYSPGVFRSPDVFLEESLWEFNFEGEILTVNSAVSPNLVGDAVGNGTQPQRLQHADWGKLDIESMLVFDPPSDQELWLGDPFIQEMSDRDGTGFGMVVGFVNNSLFVLIPETFTAP